MTTIKELFEQIEGEEWSVTEEGLNEYRLARISSAGQDFGVIIEGSTTEELLDSLEKVYENYDVSEATYLWLDGSGHGSNGAPDEMEDVLEDMKECEKMIGSLLYSLSVNAPNSLLTKFYQNYKVKVISTADAIFRLMDDNTASYEPVNFHHEISDVIISERHGEQHDVIQFTLNNRFSERDVVRQMAVTAKEVDYDTKQLINAIEQERDVWPEFNVTNREG